MSDVANPLASPAKTLADNELLLPDSRVEQLWHAIRKEFPKLPDEMTIATYIQPRRLVPRPGSNELRMMGERAVFLMLSPNPHPRHEGETLKSIASMRLQDWRADEDAAWRFVGAGDPAMKFLRLLAREHLASLKNWRELT